MKKMLQGSMYITVYVHIYIYSEYLDTHIGMQVVSANSVIIYRVVCYLPPLSASRNH